MLDNRYFNYCDDCEEVEEETLICDECKDKFSSLDEYYYGDDGTTFCCTSCVLNYFNINIAE